MPVYHLRKELIKPGIGSRAKLDGTLDADEGQVAVRDGPLQAIRRSSYANQQSAEDVQLALVPARVALAREADPRGVHARGELGRAALGAEKAVIAA